MALIDTYKQFQTLWNQWQVDHPTFAKGVMVVEAAALGAGVDYLMNWATGAPFVFGDLKLAVVAAVVAAIRNYFKDNVSNLNLKAQQPRKV